MTLELAQNQESGGALRPAPPVSLDTALLHDHSPEDPLDLGAPTDSRGRRARVFAHRGASGLFPEHTRAAYRRAIQEGADGLEIDLHLTADGEPVCFHDATVDRTSNGTGSVAELSLAHMRSLDVTSWKTPKLPGDYGTQHQQLMTLADVLELMIDAGRDLDLAVELKHPSPYGDRLETKVLRTLLRFGWDPETSAIPAGEFGQHAVTVSFMSFYPGSLLYLADMVAPDKLCALLSSVTEAQVQKRLEKMPLATAVRPVVAAVMRGTLRDSETLVWNGRAGIAGPGLAYVKDHRAEVKAWVARGSRLRVWTVDAPQDAALLIDLGVQEITTNYPARLLQTVASAS
ncbi:MULTISPECIES: glycerophosphodiester phosphodiesterase [unclassified Nesterenkonia]|uniref:glycerophosphodiester phosphodiesterase n=1 Tax=unclassified Nesterenkonia TaxID=2629769 RepID=UPI001F4D0923|nr:glycerophosphodiester phosphodiesterase [Nesterenkonia sp. DZ6]MCH8563322.1 glycerophosphodiester phosphodiesterase [Nesterenkonia sp. YGD6]